MTATAEPMVLKAEDRSYEPSRYLFGNGGGAEVTILGSCSNVTGRTFWPPLFRCPQTGGTVSDVVLAIEGVLWSWTYVHDRWRGEVLPGGPDGYGVGLVDLDGDGPRIAAVLLGDQTAWTIGERMRAVELPFRIVDGSLRSLLAFRSVNT